MEAATIMVIPIQGIIRRPLLRLRDTVLLRHTQEAMVRHTQADLPKAILLPAGLHPDHPALPTAQAADITDKYIITPKADR